jgi:prepilin-type N-terminal cleavage/methylation domain-containing protein
MPRALRHRLFIPLCFKQVNDFCQLALGKVMISMRRITEFFSYGERGFTLIELLVVVAILGVLAAVAVPNVGGFIGKGQDEAYATELYNIRVGTMALLADSDSKLLDNAVGGNGTADMTSVTADSGNLTLASYLNGLNEDGTVASDCKYTFTIDGEVVNQITP